MVLGKFLKRATEEESNELTIQGDTIFLGTPENFRFSLEGRQDVPIEKVMHYLDATYEDLKQEKSTSETVRFFIQEKLLESDLMDIVKSMNMRLFSNDHQWRAIFQAFKSKDQSYTKHCRVALSVYLKFVENKMQLVDYLLEKYDSNTAAEDFSEADNDNEDIELPSVEESQDEIETENVDGTVFIVPPKVEETKVEEAKVSSKLQQLIKAEPVNINLKPEEKIDIRLASIPCQIVGGIPGSKPIKLIDHKGRSFRLNPGLNKVGRDSESDVKFDESCAEISRLHVLIDVNDNNSITLTDMSSYGTYIPYKYVEGDTLLK